MTATATAPAPTTEITEWACGHLHTDGGGLACSTSLDEDCIDCVEAHIATCAVCLFA